jgi:hypothetical protein
MTAIAEFLVSQITAIVAIIAAGLLLYETVTIYRRRRAGAAAGPTRISWVYIIGITVTTVSFFVTIFLFWQPKDAWELWREDIAANLATCIANNQPRITSRLDKDDLGFNCLALALDRNALPTLKLRADTQRTRRGNVDRSNIVAMLTYERAGAELMRDAAVAEILSSKIGIHSNLFLGTGYSLPSWDRRSVTASSNFRPGIREYLVRNYCVSSDRKCGTNGVDPYNNAWTWTFDKREVETRGNDAPLLGTLLLSKPPNLADEAERVSWQNGDRKLVERYIGGEAAAVGRILVRIAEFPEGQYEGTLGPPWRTHTFFADARDVWHLSYDETVILAGVVPVDPAKDKVFIWIIRLSENNLKQSGLATWQYVFQLLNAHRDEIEDADSYGL